jgi:hypothetical protein
MNAIYINLLNPFNVTNDIFNKINKLNLNQNITLDHVINELHKKDINIKNISLGLLSKATFTEPSYFQNITFDDLFLFLISILTFILVISKNYNTIENSNFKFSKKVKQRIRFIKKILKYFLGFIYILYGLYMIKLVLSNKQFILTNRYIYIYTYIITGLTLLKLYFF